MSSVQPTVLQFVYSGPRETVWFSEPQHGLHCDGGPSDRDHCQHQVWEVRISGTLQLLLGMIDYCFCQFVYFWNEKSVGSVWDLVRRYQVSDWEITPAGQNKLVWTKLKSVSLFSRQRNNELAGENLRWLEKVFQRTVGDHGEITLNDFKTIVQSKNVSSAFSADKPSDSMMYCSLSLWSESSRFLTKMTADPFPSKNSLMRFISSPVKLQRIRSSSCSKFMILTVRENKITGFQCLNYAHPSHSPHHNTTNEKVSLMKVTKVATSDKCKSEWF